jgi:cytochrome b
MMEWRAFLQTMTSLASASLGFVAALAWNEAIQAGIKQVFGSDDSVGGLFLYAIIATVLAIVVLSLLARAAARVGGEARITREVD